MAFTTKTDFWRQPFFNDASILSYSTISADVVNYEQNARSSTTQPPAVRLKVNNAITIPNSTADNRDQLLVPAIAPNCGTNQSPSYGLCSNAEELEREIAILRRSNAEFLAVKKTQDRERAQLECDRREMERHFNTEHARLEAAIHSERCRLAKERSVLEIKMKETTAPPSSSHSGELTSVKEQLATLQRELVARQKIEADTAYASQQRVSRMEEELQKMRQSTQAYELTIAKLEANNARSEEVLKRASISSVELMHEVKSVEKDYGTIRRQLDVAEQAIAEYEQDIQGYIETIAKLNEGLTNCNAVVALNEKRLSALDDLENEVNTLQTQLSAALEQQLEASKTNQALPMSENVLDLVAAVKLTLLYVQNKLTSRETMGHDAELEKLKAELFDLRDTLDKRDSQELLSRRHSEELQKSEELRKFEEMQKSQETQAVKHAEELQLVKQKSEENMRLVLKEIQDTVSSSVAAYKQELLELRRLLQLANTRCEEVVAESKHALGVLVHFQNEFDSHLAVKNDHIENLAIETEALRTEVEQSRENLSAAEMDHECEIGELQRQNIALREQIQISNNQMDQLDCLVMAIESERKASKGLQEEVQDVEKSLNAISSAAVSVALDDSVSHSLTGQLETETQRNDELELKNAKLQKEVERLQRQLEDAIGRQGEAILADVGIQKLSSDLLNMRKQIEQLSSDKMKLMKMQSSGDVAPDKQVRSIPSPYNVITKTTQTFRKSRCKCQSVVFESSTDDILLAAEEGEWKQFCKMILENGIRFLNREQLSKLHKMIYQAGYRIYMKEFSNEMSSFSLKKETFIVEMLEHNFRVVQTKLKQRRSKEKLRGVRQITIQRR